MEKHNDTSHNALEEKPQQNELKGLTGTISSTTNIDT